MNKSINLIIIGARNYSNTYNINDYTTYNNPYQADINELQQFDKIICIDPMYDNTIINEKLYIIQEKYIIGDVKYLDINSHNIIIDFCNMFDRNWCSAELPNIELNNYNNYNITWLCCGCMWNNGLPINNIKKIIENNLYTSTNQTSVESYLNIIHNIEKIDNVNEIELYIKSCYEIMGTLIWRGCSRNNYNTENVLFELFKIIETPLNKDDKINFNYFLEEKIHWNMLNYNIKKNIIKFIYKIDL